MACALGKARWLEAWLEEVRAHHRRRISGGCDGERARSQSLHRCACSIPLRCISTDCSNGNWRTGQTGWGPGCQKSGGEAAGCTEVEGRKKATTRGAPQALCKAAGPMLVDGAGRQAAGDGVGACAGCKMMAARDQTAPAAPRRASGWAAATASAMLRLDARPIDPARLARLMLALEGK